MPPGVVEKTTEIYLRNISEVIQYSEILKLKAIKSQNGVKSNIEKKRDMVNRDMVNSIAAG